MRKEMLSILIFWFGISLVSCEQKCNPNTVPSSVLFPSKWKLTNITTQTGTPRKFSVGETLDLALIPNGFSESIIQNDIAVTTKEIKGWTDDCTSNTVLMTYKDGTQRNLIIQRSHDPFQIEATGYVKQVGGADDTLRYYYERAQ